MIFLCSLSLSDWGNIFTIILGAAAVFTAIATAIALFRQYELQKKQHKLNEEQLDTQQLEHQPFFVFRQESHLEMGNMTTSFTITNTGCMIKEFPNIKVNKIIGLSAFNKSTYESFMLYVPIYFYTGTSHLYDGAPKNNQYKGEICKVHGAEGNLTKLYDIRENLTKNIENELKSDDWIIFGHIYEFCKIGYIDMYGNKRYEYNRNGELFSKNEYDRIISEKKEKYGSKRFKYEDFPVDEIVKDFLDKIHKNE